MKFWENSIEFDFLFTKKYRKFVFAARQQKQKGGSVCVVRDLLSSFTFHRENEKKNCHHDFVLPIRMRDERSVMLNKSKFIFSLTIFSLQCQMRPRLFLKLPTFLWAIFQSFIFFHPSSILFVIFIFSFNRRNRRCERSRRISDVFFSLFFRNSPISSIQPQPRPDS